MQLKLLKTFLILATSSLIFMSISCWSEPEEPLISIFPLQNYDQVLTDWIKPTDPAYDKLLLDPEQQKIYTEELYRHYFSTEGQALSPWNAAYIQKIFSIAAPLDIYSQENKVIDFYDNKTQTDKDKIGYGANFRPYTADWIETIKKNINLTQFNKKMIYQSTRRGIAIDNLYARMLPTDEVHFYNYKMAGQGYPFDNLQASVVWAGSPVYILGETLDHAWLLVLTPDYYIAWVKSTGIAYADNHFIHEWQMKAREQMLAISHTQIPIIDTESHVYRFAGYVGMIFPYDKTIPNKE